MNGRVLIYGATGYTGRLIVDLARTYGVQPVVAGRDTRAVAELANAYSLPQRVFSLDNAGKVIAGLDGVQVVLNCAGPFVHTSRPIVDACIANGAHYLDITGEIVVFEALAARSAEAQNAGIMLLPGVGFDVVPTDCLAAHLKRRLPGARVLRLGIAGTGRLSRGTRTTMLEHHHMGGMIRRDGSIARVPAAWRTRQIDFGNGPRTTVTIPWGDVATAYYTTAIPNIEVYARTPALMCTGLRLGRHVGWLTKQRAVKSVLRRLVRAGEPGPTRAEREQGRSFVWGRVEDEQGRAAEARMSGPDGYTMTAHTALLAVQRVLRGNAPTGFQTPALAYGPDFVLETPNTERTDLVATES